MLFQTLNGMLLKDNYVARRQGLTLLNELIGKGGRALEQAYTSNPDNLKLIMNMLRDKGRSIQFESFFLFKVFILCLIPADLARDLSIMREREAGR